MARCQRGFQYTGITSPRAFCILRPYCPVKSKERVPLRIPSLNRKSMVKVGLEGFVSEIDIADDRSWFWKHGIELPEVFVLLWQLLVNEEVLNKASSKGLHDFLGFSGRIFLSLVMPDELLDRLRIEDYFKLINDLRPDATTIPDSYTYVDDPLFLSWSQTVKLVSLANDFLKLDIPLIGSVKGANHLQIDWTIRKQVEMGFVSFAMPVRELFEDNLLDDLLPGALMSLRWFSKKIKTNFELLLYGIGHRLKYGGISSYSNLSWFLEAKHGRYYKKGRLYDLRDPEIRFKECNCGACKGLMPQEIIDLMLDDKEAGLRVLAFHNLLDMKEALSRTK
ncbi:MAG: hypothetical protein FGF52_05845 [Candidatus Brockarchaeota archaeon]|nr:hypothetical protein [Candidatus Brockarchaeota archaeon]